jgi:hypothetical protein
MQSSNKPSTSSIDPESQLPKLSINELNARTWRDSLVTATRTSGKFGASGHALINSQPLVILKEPTETDLLPSGNPQYECTPGTTTLTDRSFSLFRDNMRRYVVLDDKRVLDDVKLHTFIMNSISEESLLFIKTFPAWDKIESDPQGNKAIQLLELAMVSHSSKSSSVMLKRAVDLFSVVHGDTLLGTLDDIKKRVAQFTDDHSTDGKTVSIDTLTCVAIFQILQGTQYQPFRDYCLNDDELLTNPVKLINSLIKFMTSRRAITADAPASTQGAYVATTNQSTKRHHQSVPAAVPYCELCFIRTKGRKFTKHGTPGTPPCNSGNTTSTGLRQPKPSDQTTVDKLISANRTYLAHYQADPTSEATINALVAVANMSS